MSKKLLLLIIPLFVFSGSVAMAEEKINVLIFSGRNNHNFKDTSIYMKDVLEGSGVFTVDIINPEKTDAGRLAKCDIIVSNYNNLDAKDIEWSDSFKKAFLDFIAAGGGHVTIHAGGSGFYKWDEYHKIAHSWGNNTNHGPVHAFEVKACDKDHPITGGLGDFWVVDELWCNPDLPADSRVLMSSY